ncbi:MAG: hypothetical protein ACM34K_13490 [Bacillota bacterium]
MDIAVNIFLIVLLISASLLCVYLVITLKKLTQTITAVQADVQQLKNKIDPILTNVDILSGKVVLITEEVESVVSAVKILIDSMKNKAEDLLDKTKKFKANIEHPNADWFKKVVGISRGVSAFWTTLKNK